MSVLYNAKEEKFVQCLIIGMSQRKAYREAFPSSARWKDSTVDVKASVLFSQDKILERYQELLNEAKSNAIMSRIDRMVVLSEIAGDVDERPDSRIRAIDTLNKMDGEYTTKLELLKPVDETIREMEAFFDEKRRNLQSAVGDTV